MRQHFLQSATYGTANPLAKILESLETGVQFKAQGTAATQNGLDLTQSRRNFVELAKGRAAINLVGNINTPAVRPTTPKFF